MGFLTNMLSAVVKTATSPIAVAVDVVNVATGEEPEATKKVLKSAARDVDDAMDDLEDLEIL